MDKTGVEALEQRVVLARGRYEGYCERSRDPKNMDHREFLLHAVSETRLELLEARMDLLCYWRQSLPTWPRTEASIWGGIDGGHTTVEELDHGT